MLAHSHVRVIRCSPPKELVFFSRCLTPEDSTSLGKYIHILFLVTFCSFLQVRRIFFPPKGFTGRSTNYACDIVILWLAKQISLNENVLPACLHWTDNDSTKMSENLKGKVNNNSLLHTYTVCFKLFIFLFNFFFIIIIISVLFNHLQFIIKSILQS